MSYAEEQGARPRNRELGTGIESWVEEQRASLRNGELGKGTGNWA